MSTTVITITVPQTRPDQAERLGSIIRAAIRADATCTVQPGDQVEEPVHIHPVHVEGITQRVLVAAAQALGGAHPAYFAPLITRLNELAEAKPDEPTQSNG